MGRQLLKKGNLYLHATEAQAWINETLGITQDSKDVAEKDPVDLLFQTIETGVVLCQLLQKVSDKANVKFKTNAAPKSFQARDNVVSFIQAAKDLGLPAVSLFDPDDLVLRKNESLVVNSILKLSELAESKFGVKAASIVQFEKEIAAAEAEKKEAEAKGEKDDDDDEEEEDATSPATSPEKAASPAPAVTVTAPAPAATPSPAPPAEAAPAAAAAETPATPAKPKKGVSFAAEEDDKKDDKPKEQLSSPPPKRPPFVPVVGDEVDEAIAVVYNANPDWTIAIKRVAIKNKKKRRDVRHRGKGEYKIGSEKVFVRLMAGAVVVRWDNEWIDIETFVEEKLKH